MTTKRKRFAAWNMAWVAACCVSVSCKKEAASPGNVAGTEIRGERIAVGATNSAAPESPKAAATASVQAAATSTPQPASLSADLPEGKDGEHVIVGFDKLASFAYDVPIEPSTNSAPTAPSASQIPSAIKAFDKKRVALRGFMLPLKVEGGLVTELLIMRDQSMCCYGTVPKINEWVSVKMSGKGVKPIMDQPVTMFGTLHVGEMRENGYLVGIYGMDGEKMSGPLGM